MSDDQTVRDDLRDGVLTLELHRPEVRNALDDAMRAELLAHLDRAMGTRTTIGATMRILGARRLIDTMVELPKPVVAAVEGYAVGAGFGVALASDIIVASPTADFRLSFIARGLAPDSAATWFLNRQIGERRTKELALTGRSVSADEAHRLGLAAHLWPTESFDERLAAYTTELAAGPTAALGLTKRIVRRAADADFAAVWDLETLGAAVSATTDDHREALAAWREKRPARFEGH